MGYLDEIVNRLGGVPAPSGGDQSAAAGPHGISDIANRYAGEPTSRFYHPNPRLACASFVTQVLKDAGVLGQTQGSPSAHLLEGALPGIGASQVLPRGTPIGQAAQSLQPGDVLFFQDQTGATHHTGIYSGNGRMTDTSSNAGVVKTRPITAPGYGAVSAYRAGGAPSAPAPASAPQGYLTAIVNRLAGQ